MSGLRHVARRRSGRMALLLALMVCVLGVLASLGTGIAAAAPAAAPAWQLTSIAEPTDFAPGENYTTNSGPTGNAGLAPGPQYQINAVNVGGASTDGSMITITDTLPVGVTPDPAGATANADAAWSWSNLGGNPFSCSASGQVVTCTTATQVTPGQMIQVEVPVDVSASATGSVTNAVTVTGGGAPQAATQEQTLISATSAGYGIDSFSSQALNADGSVDSQAGSTPYEDVTSFAMNTTLDSLGGIENDGNWKEVQVALPSGFVGYPDSMPQCPLAELDAGNNCPSDTQIGQIIVQLSPAASGFTIDAPVFNMQTGGNEPAKFGFNVLGAPVVMDASVRTGSDYGVDITVPDITSALPVLGETLTLWGDPNDSSHDLNRVIYDSCSDHLYGFCEYGQSTDAAPVAFLANGTDCSQPQTVTASTDSWQNAGTYVTATSSSPELTGCDALPFNPSISVQPTTATADSPSGLDVDLRIPQNGSPVADRTSDLQNATVTLPQGVTIDPSAASGLTSCTPVEIGMNNGNAPTCPDSSKIGSVTITTPLLSDALTGGIYVAQQNDNPFNSTYAIYVTAYADGAWVKLAGEINANSTTGQLTATFNNNPQLPFSDLQLDFYGGSQGILATPQQLGTYTATSNLTPWSGGSAVTPSDTFRVTSGGVSGFAPTFTAGAVNPRADAFSPFVLTMTRSDTDQNFSGLSVKLPDGELAKLAGVGECTTAELAAAATATGTAEQADPSCPSSSLVGTVTVQAGVGSTPYQLGGKVYLTGPYKNGPYGLAIVVPALAGPYDLGTVVVRQQLDINTVTAQVTDVSDAFPTILQGIPLDLRQVSVDLSRKDFTINPTSCAVKSVTGTVISTAGSNAGVSSRFQVGDCAGLGFSPKLKMTLTGKGQTKTGDHPTLTATLTQPGGQAHLSKVRVVLPLSLALDPNNSEVVCNYQTAKAVTSGPVPCPASTIVGSATAYTNLLSKPLSGKVYLVQGIKDENGQEVHTLPTLLVALRGQIPLDLRAQTSTTKANQLVTTFPTIPDAAISKFVLKINGGKKGILVITNKAHQQIINICASKQVTDATLDAQSGKVKSSSITMSTPCKAVKTK